MISKYFKLESRLWIFLVWFIELGNEMENSLLISNQHLQLVLTGVNYAAFLVVSIEPVLYTEKRP